MSRYTSTENLKITYLLGAGASYHALPIWKEQGLSMLNVAGIADYTIHEISEDSAFQSIRKNSQLLDFFSEMKRFGRLAMEYGSIDIYAKRLNLIEHFDELNQLKYCLSVYFDLWELFAFKTLYRVKVDGTQQAYDKVDKRYFALLSVLLEKGKNQFPQLNQNISFVTWNYDLQLESAFESFMPRKFQSLSDTNNYLNFMGLDASKNNVVHLNGFRGYFRQEKKSYDNVPKEKQNSLEEYLYNLLQNFSQFTNPDFTNSIKYAWEASSETLESAKRLFANSDVLIIIGYSFPAFNRKIDMDLIKTFESGGQDRRIIYQDPYSNQDIIESMFAKPLEVKQVKENISQFYVPHEFLFPQPGEEYYV